MKEGASLRLEEIGSWRRCSFINLSGEIWFTADFPTDLDTLVDLLLKLINIDFGPIPCLNNY